MPADSGNLPRTFFLPDDETVSAPADVDVIAPDAMLGMLAAGQRDLASDALNAREAAQMLVFLSAGTLALLSVDPCSGGLSVRLQPLQDVVVPGSVSEALLGGRRQEVHDLCNNLAAARLNGELAQLLLARQEEGVDAQVTEALAALVRVNAAVEEQMRELQEHLVLKLDGNYPA